jgi:hypothetical protein
MTSEQLARIQVWFNPPAGKLAPQPYAQDVRALLTAYAQVVQERDIEQDERAQAEIDAADWCERAIKAERDFQAFFADSQFYANRVLEEMNKREQLEAALTAILAYSSCSDTCAVDMQEIAREALEKTLEKP